MSIARVLIVAGSDSGGGAGIQADIKTVTMLGGHALTAITAITAQNTLGVDEVFPLSDRLVVRQMSMVAEDLGVDTVKIGMLGGASIADAVADELASGVYHAPIVLDPVMVASSGAALADDRTIAAFERLARMSALVTPNLPELARLCGFATIGPDDIAAAGQHYAARIETTSTHGTGCTLASGIATGLAQGLDLQPSIARAIRFVRAALEAAPGIGDGHGPMGHALGVRPFEVIRG